MPQIKKQLTELEADLKEHFDKLPKDVQQAILSVDYEKTLKEITQRYHLHIDQGAKLETETTLVMLGLVAPKEYSKSLIFEARIDPKAAELIASEVNDTIFRPIITSLHDALMRQLGGPRERSDFTENNEHDLSPVDIGVPTTGIIPKKEKSKDASQDSVSKETEKEKELKETAIFTQKLEGISGEKASETVVSEEPQPSKKLYKSKLDPYHETIE